MKRLEASRAIITGAAHGIGRSIAERFAEEGAEVWLADLDEAAGSGAAREFSSRGWSAHFIKCDVSSASEVKGAVTRVMAAGGAIDILCNNAAYLADHWHDAGEAQDEEWRRCLEVSLMGTQYFTREVLPQMMAQQRGSIINISSVQGLVAGRSSAAYTTVKHALIGLTRSVACDFGSYNIRCNVLCPGAISTRISPEAGSELHQRQIGKTFLGRAGQPREVANAALFLAGNESSYITGAVLAVDGGWTAI